MFRSHEVVQLTTIFYRKHKTRNQACNRETSTESSSYNQLEDVMNIKNNLFLKEQVDEKSEISNHAHDIFKSDENKTEIDHINLINIAKKLKK